MDEGLYFEHDEMEETYWWFLGRKAIVNSILARHIGIYKSERRILDIGCGTGGMLRLLSRFGEAVGVDGTPYAIERARQKTGCNVERGQLPIQLPFGKESFDLITAFDVIEHIEDDILALRSVGKILVPGGLFLCTVPALPILWSYHDERNQHKRRYVKGQLARKLEATGFRVIKITYFNAVLFPLIMAFRTVSRVLQWKGSDFAISVGWFNKPLEIILGFERIPLKYISFPIGVSLLALGQKTT